ncbi:hypothetical protein [Klebsiella variicola]|uniref:hypothetical protein n=1 Tax=Klebsiella variicola TaxID=244366 RepID=UPI00388F0D37
MLTIKMLFIDESPVSLYLKKSDEKTSIPLTIRISDSENKNNKKDLLLSITAIDNLISLAVKNRFESKIKLSMNTLKNNAANIIAIYNFINGNDSVESKFPAINIRTEDDELLFDVKKDMCVIFAISLSFESIFFSFIFSARGFLEECDGNYVLEQYNLNLERRITGKSKKDAFGDLKKQINLICEEKILKNAYVFNCVNNKIMINNDL